MIDSRVFVPHKVLNPRTQEWKFDISRILRQYGEMVEMLDDSNQILNYPAALREMQRRLILNKFDPRLDYFLAAGDMTAFAAMCLVSAAHFGRTPKQLRHNRRTDRYDVLEIISYEEEAVI